MPVVDLAVLATSTLGFSIALAWNRVASEWVESYYPASDQKTATAKKRAMAHAIAAATVITMMVIVFVVALNHASRHVSKLASAAGLGNGPAAKPHAGSASPPRRGENGIVRL